MNDNLVAVARSHSLADLLRRSAARFPDKTALIDGETSLTFAQLDAAVSATAGALLERGLAKGDRLAVLSRNSWQFVVLSFACARAGVMFVPINFMLKANEVDFILEHSEAIAVVADDGPLQATLAEALDLAGIEPDLRGWIGPEGSPVPDGWESVSDWARGVAREIEVVVGDDDPIRIMYTSGTESRPKGALSS
ncbi:MAG: AMP-binding protein, partial [Actinomycetota bacterium]|nr:AMP-binding protein [Actinomycetota bacterium]